MLWHLHCKTTRASFHFTTAAEPRVCCEKKIGLSYSMGRCTLSNYYLVPYYIIISWAKRGFLTFQNWNRQNASPVFFSADSKEERQKLFWATTQWQINMFKATLLLLQLATSYFPSLKIASVVTHYTVLCKIQKKFSLVKSLAK